MTSLQAPPTSLLDPYTGAEPFPLYTARVTIEGGQAGHGRASGRVRSDDGDLDLNLRLPKALGGPGGGANPEQLLAAGIGACFHGAMILVARKRRMTLPAETGIAVAVTFARDPADGQFLLQASLDVQLGDLDEATGKTLLTETEAICPYAKMARQGIQLDVRRSPGAIR